MKKRHHLLLTPLCRALWLMAVLPASHAIAASNFNIDVKSGTTLPTNIFPGQTIQAYYTITNLTHSLRQGYALQGLPLTVTQNTSTPNSCSNPINLLEYPASCTLRLDITGPVQASFALCRGNNCTTTATPLKVKTPSPGPLHYDNGPLVNGPGEGDGGNNVSYLQTSLGMNNIGFTVNGAPFYLADDFTVPAGQTWTVNQLTFFAYQTNSTTTSTFTAGRFQIVDGLPSGSPTVVCGNIAINAPLLANSWSNIYRTIETTKTSTARPVMQLLLDAGTCVLPAGTYWLEWKLEGSLASGPFAPPITINGDTTTGNALQWNGFTWDMVKDSATLAPQGFPFLLDGIIS